MAEAEWWISDAPVAYDEAVRRMEARVQEIALGHQGDAVWLLEHPPLYTAGTSAKDEDLIEADRLPVHRSGRGGQYTYHGPGQRIAYVMRDLTRDGRDLRSYVGNLEQWVIDTLARFNLSGERRPGRVGVWIDRGGGREDKIAAVGVRVRRWVAYHGISLNVDPDLEHYRGIVACGVQEHGVTSMVDLGLPVTMAEVDAELRQTFPRLFP
ncbi:MAG: lipoyl(octanoyl) transferase LipB [Alphaproteobacteria bacterium]|nr:lipoyl(octanoyl) transferase LipB [Alphaproteobacteria bacterium]